MRGTSSAPRQRPPEQRPHFAEFMRQSGPCVTSVRAAEELSEVRAHEEEQ